LQGCSRFIKKLWALLITNEGELSHLVTDDEPTKETMRYLHNMIKRVSHNIENLQFNTCVSEFMIFINHIHGLETINIDIIKTFIVLINPFMPHLAQELWALSGNKSELTFTDWPNYDENQFYQIN
jgi:leucyl-tRNA synthetase